MRTISQPVVKNKIFCVRDMPRLGWGAEFDSRGVSGVDAVSSWSLMRCANCGRFQWGNLQRSFAQDDRIDFRVAISLLLDIRVEHTFLLEVVGHCVLRQKRRLQPDFSADPLALGVGSVGQMVATSSTAELGTEVRALNLIKLADLAPSGIADGSRDVDL
jgi:hypothetical protein